MLTVEKLARLLSDSFEQDSWGDIDPALFKEVAEPEEYAPAPKNSTAENTNE